VRAAKCRNIHHRIRVANSHFGDNSIIFSKN
jgi:hypothetical protein